MQKGTLAPHLAVGAVATLPRFRGKVRSPVGAESRLSDRLAIQEMALPLPPRCQRRCFLPKRHLIRPELRPGPE